jgi:hypothetical protein
MLSCFGPKAILRCPGIPGSERLEDYRGVRTDFGTRLLHRLRDSVSGIVYTASPGNKDVPATPCRRR